MQWVCGHSAWVAQLFLPENIQICERNKLIYWMKYAVYLLTHIVIFD